MTNRRNVIALIGSNLFGGVGVASSVAVGGLLVERLASTEAAGFAQAVGILGAGLAAVPLARLAQRRNRRIALGLGYLVPILGAALVVVAALTEHVIGVFLGLALFGVSQAVNLQSRYAAAENAPLATRARTMSIVIWSTTVGSVVGPNLTDPGDHLGRLIALPQYAGAYLFSMTAFALAAAIIAAFLTQPAGEPAAPGGAASSPRVLGSRAALAWAMRHPVARYAVVVTAVAHAVMVMVMVMTPLHMTHHGMTLAFVGVVISLHTLGMYAFSPVFGWMVDRWGGVRIAAAGMVVLAASAVLGFIAASHGPTSAVTTPVALLVLGLGWSMCLIAASALLASATSEEVRLPLQGATDAGMNYAGALAAAVSGPLLAWGGFQAVNTVAVLLLVPGFALLPSALRSVASARVVEPLPADL